MNNEMEHEIEETGKAADRVFLAGLIVIGVVLAVMGWCIYCVLQAINP